MISSEDLLSGFSKAKNTRDMIAKNVVYITNQKEPISNPLRLISCVMCITFLDTLTQAAAQAYDRLSAAG